VITVTATDYEFDSDTLQEGWTSFRVVNNGDAFHAAMLVKLEGGRTLVGFREAYAEALKTGGPWNAFGLRGGIVRPPPKRDRRTPRCIWPRVATLGLAPGLRRWRPAQCCRGALVERDSTATV
jgi:hypothetical protein